MTSSIPRPAARAPVWNSAFQIIEAPMSCMNKLLNTHGHWYHFISYSPVTMHDRKITILATAGQAIAYPISWIFTPLTIIADIFAGALQATIRTCQGASRGEIQSILHKKIIAAPAQQIAYTVNNILVFSSTFRVATKAAVFSAAVFSVIRVSVITIGVFVYARPPDSKIIASATTRLFVFFVLFLILVVVFCCFFFFF